MGSVTVSLQPDGPHSPDDTRQAAWAVAGCVRYLNYATGSHASQGLACPADVYDVLGALSAGAGRLDQLFGQLGRWLREQAAAGRVRDVTGADLGGVLAEAGRCLSAASAAAAALTGALASAQGSVADLAGPAPDGGR
jgi:hypothetical protein